MNKQLILKFKIEFDHWLNGGKVLMHYGSKWVPVTLDAKWEFFMSDLEKMGSFGYIIDDEYVEFRKALAEGKTIQYYVDSFMGWQDCTNQISPSRQFLVPPTKYRIKPEVPKFKVGDWITDGVEVWQHKENCRVKNQTNWNLWQPKPGEYCWFWENGDKMPLFGKLTGMTESGKFFSDWGTYDYCEPFIGKLPTILKD